MKQVAVVLEQDLEALFLIVANSAEQRCASVLVWLLQQVGCVAKLAQDLGKLLVPVHDRLVEGGAAPLVLD
jgi:hypothetical protein